MAYKPVKVALIGSGNISYTYLNTLTSGFSIIDVVGCSDLIPEKDLIELLEYSLRSGKTSATSVLMSKMNARAVKQ